MEIKSLYQRLWSYHDTKELPQEKVLLDLSDEVVTVLENEDPLYRPLTKDGRRGGLLDFTKESKVVIIVPDIHARRDFLLKLISHSIRGVSILRLLHEEKITIICAGDAIHSETMPDARERWIKAYDDYINGIPDGLYMRKEMSDSLYTLMIIMELKKAFPHSFHFLKGNHENITNSSLNGDYPFKKFAEEGAMVKDFITKYYSDALLHVIDCYEKSLPLVCIFDKFAVSHAEPLTAFKKDMIINCHMYPGVIEGLTWTKNGDAFEGSVPLTFANLNPDYDKNKALWFAGHRTVSGTYEMRQGGQFIQFHNPDLMNVILLGRDRKFDPSKNIIGV